MDAAFKRFASKGTEATSADINRWSKDAGVLGKNLTSNHIDIAFSKVKAKGAQNVTFREMDALIDEMAKAYMADKKTDLETAKSELKEKLSGAESKAHGATTANVTEINGDLFASSDSLVHCVSSEFKMSRGIAIKFRELFDGVEELRSQNAPIGGVAVLERNRRFIYYMVTKERQLDLPTLENVRSSLTAVKDHMTRKNVVLLSMPRIGCGLDKLDWKDVHLIVKDVFDNTDIRVTVYTL